MTKKIGNFSDKKIPLSGNMGQRLSDDELLFRDTRAELMTALDIDLLLDAVPAELGIDVLDSETF